MHIDVEVCTHTPHTHIHLQISCIKLLCLRSELSKINMQNQHKNQLPFYIFVINKSKVKSVKKNNPIYNSINVVKYIEQTYRK